MRVLMLGWEFPPHISGGLGTACYGLTRALAASGIEIVFVLPRPADAKPIPRVRYLGPRSRAKSQPRSSSSSKPAAGAVRIEFRTVDVPLRAYEGVGEPVGGALPSPLEGGVIDAQVESPAPQARAIRVEGYPARLSPEDTPLPCPSSSRGEGDKAGPPVAPPPDLYAGNLLDRVDLYADAVCELAAGEKFDLVHGHDWMTFPAAERAAGAADRPMIAHFHSTEFDRCGMQAQGPVCAVERRGAWSADRVIAVSRYTAGMLTDKYAVPAERIAVVPNAVLSAGRVPTARPPELRRGKKHVLFLGRITRQKGPGYFVWAARKLLDLVPNVRFTMAGEGDQLEAMRRLAAELGMADRFAFPGFLRDKAPARMFRSADLFIMPSVSEPFGIAALEAMLYGVPTIVSRQCGVSEFARGLLAVDFWDTAGIAQTAAGVLTDARLFRRLSKAGAAEARTFRWAGSAEECGRVYRAATGKG